MPLDKTLLCLAVVALAALSGVDIHEPQAQMDPAAECSNTPAAGNWVECKEDATSTSNININLNNGVNIETSGASDHGGERPPSPTLAQGGRCWP